MRLFGFEISRQKAASNELASTPFSSWQWGGSGWGWGGVPWVQEPYAGAWQKNDSCWRSTILAFSAVYACVAMISDDVSKLELQLIEQTDDGIWLPVTAADRNSPFLPVLASPNEYQTRQQFLSMWLTAKLLYGNTYVYKERDDRRMVRAMHLLPPLTTIPKVATPSGAIFYELGQDVLAGIDSADLVPASEVIHDRCLTPFHPLLGVSPIYACGSSAAQGMRIQENAEAFFRNMSRPAGHLSSDRELTDEYVEKVKARIERAFYGPTGMGRTLVTGGGWKYETMTMPATDAQLIEQLKWTAEDVARCFKVPPWKIGAGADPKHANSAQQNQDYYSQTLQSHIEAIEALLTEGLGLSAPVNGHRYAVQLNLDGLLRMDPLSRADLYEKAIKSAWMSPDEVRASENRPPVEGGSTPYLQQQNFSLAALAKRDAQDDPFKTAPPPSASAPDAQPADGAPGDAPPKLAAPEPQAPPPPKALADALARAFAAEAAL